MPTRDKNGGCSRKSRTGLVHMGTNSAEKEGMSAIVCKYWTHLKRPGLDILCCRGYY